MNLRKEHLKEAKLDRIWSSEGDTVAEDPASMASPHSPSTVASARVMLVPLLCLVLLVMSSLLLEHHQPLTLPGADASGVQVDGDPGHGEYIQAITDGGAVSGNQEDQHDSESEPRRRTRMITDETSRKEDVEKDVIDLDGTKDSVEDLIKQYNKGGVKDNRTDKVGKVRNNEHGDEANHSRSHHKAEKLGKSVASY